MGNSQTKGQIKGRQNKKQVHWRAAELPSPPGKPQLVPGFENTPDVVTIKWDRPVRDGGSNIIGYLVEHRRTGSPHWVRATPILVNVPELTLSGLEPGWRYQFRVSAKNNVGISEPGEISEPLTVTLQRSVITAPKFTEELKETTALEEEMCEFVVHCIGQPQPKICWFKDGFEIFSSRRTRIITDNDKSVLTIHQIALADEGEIKCTATNKAGHASTKTTLTVEAPPVIRLPRQYEDGLLFELDEMIRLKVSIAGRPQPLIFWAHNGETIQNDDRYEITNTDRSSVLKVGEAKRSDRGEYQIRAVNKIGEDSTSFLVTVTDKPKPPNHMKVVMTLGKSVTLGWEAPDDDGGCKIGNYIVEYYRLGWNVWLKASTCRQTQSTLSDLIEGSEYKFRVKAESPYGVSDPSDETDVIFIPDPKRGLMTAPSRSRSQPRDEIEPVAPKRRSASSTRPGQEAPVPPKREKLRSPQKSPEGSPEPIRRPNNRIIYDRSSMARELAYGSPDVTYKKQKQQPELPKPVVALNELSALPPSPTKRDKSPNRINQMLSNLLPKKSPSPNPPEVVKTPEPSPIVKDTPKEEPIQSMKGDHLDRLSPSIEKRRLSSPMLDRRSSSPFDRRNRSPSLGDSLRRSPSPVPNKKIEDILMERKDSLRQSPGKNNHLGDDLMERRDSLRQSPGKNNHLGDDLIERRDSLRQSPGKNQNLRDNLIERRDSLRQSPGRTQNLGDDLIERRDSLRRSPSPINRNLGTDLIERKQSTGRQSPTQYSVITGDEDSRRGSMQSNPNNDMVHGSSEFMLVILEDHDNATQDYYIFEDSLIPPPMSLSAPELAANSELFNPLKRSLSSTELLHERAMARFVKEDADGQQRLSASFEKIPDDERRPSVPKILINSKDNDDSERKPSLIRRLSNGLTTKTQHNAWTIRRNSLRNNNEETLDLYDMKMKHSDKMSDIQKQSDFEENNPTRLSPKTSPIMEKKPNELYSEEELTDSEDERLKYDLSPPNIQVEEEETYHPRMMMIPTQPSKYDEPFEILSKPNPLPDPNFVPKPILKQPQKKLSPDKPARKFITEPTPTVQKPKLPDQSAYRPRTPSPVRVETPIPTSQRSQMIASAEAAKNKRMLNRQSSEEEYKVVADHYGTLVRELSTTKRYQTPLYLNRDALKAAAGDDDEDVDDNKTPEKQPSPVPTPVVNKKEIIRASRKEPLAVPETKPKIRSRSSSRTRESSRVPEVAKTEISRGRELTKQPPKTREVSRTRDGSKTRSRDVSKTRSRDGSKTRDVSKTRNISRTRNTSKTRAIIQDKLEVARTPTPQVLEQVVDQHEVNIQVRSTFEYLTDLAMFIVAFYFYLFKDPVFAIPILIIMAYRQLKDEVIRFFPWIFKPKKPQ